MIRELLLSAAIALGPAFSSTPAKPPVVTNRIEGTIYVGDSRFNGMEMHVGRGEGYVIAKDCMGYYWLRGEATAKASGFVSSTRRSPLGHWCPTWESMT